MAATRNASPAASAAAPVQWASCRPVTTPATDSPSRRMTNRANRSGRCSECRGTPPLARGPGRGGQVDEEPGSRPQPVPRARRDCRADQEQRRADAVADEVRMDVRAGGGHVPPGPQVADHQDEPDRGVAESEPATRRAGDLGHAGGHRHHAGHAEEGEHAEHHVVGVEPVRVQRGARPGPPAQGQQRRERGGARPRRGGEQVSALRDEQHESEVEEQLQSRRAAVVVLVEVRRADQLVLLPLLGVQRLLVRRHGTPV